MVRYLILALALLVSPAFATPPIYGPLQAQNALSEIASNGTQATARVNLGLGSIATQNANAVTITGGSAIFTGLSTFNANTGSISSGISNGLSFGWNNPIGSGDSDIYFGQGAGAGGFLNFLAVPSTGVPTSVAQLSNAGEWIGQSQILIGSYSGSATSANFYNKITCSDSVSYSAPNGPECEQVNLNLDGTSAINGASALDWGINNTGGASPASSTGTFLVGAVGESTMSNNVGGFATTLAAAATTGSTTISVASATGFVSGLQFYLMLSNGLVFAATESGAPSGTTITLTSAIPSPGASSGALVAATSGETQGLYSVGYIASSADYAKHNVGAEFSEYSTTGATYLSGWDIGCQNNSPMNSSGLLYDACLRMGSASGAGGKMTIGFLTTDDSGAWPLSATGTWAQIGGITSTDNTHTMGNGIMFDVPITGDALSWNGGADYLKGDGTASLKTTQLYAYTVATLPTCNSGEAGTIAYVTDATSPTYNGTLTGGSTSKVLALCNGTAWTAH